MSRAAWRLAGVIVMLLLGLGAGLLWITRTLHDAEIRVSVPDRRGEPVRLTSGSADLEGLAAALREAGAADVLDEGDDGWLLRATLEVGTGARLVLEDERLLLASGAGGEVGLEARGGDLVIHGSTVTSWDPASGAPDAKVDDGRAWMLARDGAQVSIRDATLRMLGYDAYERYGVAIRTPGTGGSIHGSVFEGNYFGIYTYEADPMSITDSLVRGSLSYGLDLHTRSDGFLIEGNRFEQNGKHGLILAVECRDAVVRDNVASDNGEHGFVVFDRSDGALLEGNEAYGNAGTGFDVNGSAGAQLVDNLAHENTTGVHVHDGSLEAVLEGTRAAGNLEDGVRVSTGATVGRMAGTLADYNRRAGLYVDEASAQVVAGNRFLDNLVGVWVSGEVAPTSIHGSLLAENVLDGVHLTAPVPSLTLSGNQIVENGKAAFSVVEMVDARAYLADNRLRGNGQDVRIRGS